MKTKEHLALEYQAGKLLANRYTLYELRYELRVPAYCQDVIDCAIGERMFHEEVWELWNSPPKELVDNISYKGWGGDYNII